MKVGIAHIGALRVLESASVSIDFIAGSSAGAITGLLNAAGKSLDEIETIVPVLISRFHFQENR